MMTARTAAGLIAGMTQATRELGARWEALPEDDRSELIDRWEHLIEKDPLQAPSEIIASIASHSSLGEIWRRLEAEIYDSRLAYLQAIVKATIR